MELDSDSMVVLTALMDTALLRAADMADQADLQVVDTVPQAHCCKKRLSRAGNDHTRWTTSEIL